MSQPVATKPVSEKIVEFVRLLRRAGLNNGTAEQIHAFEAVQVVGLAQRRDVYWALKTTLIKSPMDGALFDEAFKLFWRGERPSNELKEQIDQTQRLGPHTPAGLNRLSSSTPSSEIRRDREEWEIEADATFSAREVLRQKDFDQMSVAEMLEVERAIDALRVVRPVRETRRFRSSEHGKRVDWPNTFRAAFKSDSEIIDLRMRKRHTKAPPLVLLVDISGSVSSYSRVFLHFAHTLMRSTSRVDVFVFGTRLTNITKPLRNRDVDVAVANVSQRVADWNGGTRIGTAIQEFNRKWARRVIGQNAHLLLMTDGLDREDTERLNFEMNRLRRFANRITWLNPLLRFDAFEAKASGIRAILPNVDEFLPIHNLNSIEDLVDLLGMTHDKLTPLKTLRLVKQNDELLSVGKP